MKLFRRLLYIIVFAYSGSTFAYTPEEGNINLTAGPIGYRTLLQSPDPNMGSPNRGGYGLIATGDSNPTGSLELAMFYMDKIFFVDDGPDVLAEKIKHIHITMGYRWWLRSWISTSLSFYSAYPLGDPVTYYSKIQPGKFMDTSARDLTEYGFDSAVQFEVIGNQRFGLVLEGRYSWCVTPKPNEQADHVAVMIGLRFMAQDRVTAEEARKNRRKR